MKLKRSVFHRYTLGAVIVLMFLGISACRFELENEIWFNKDLSGKAEITVKARDLTFNSEEEAQNRLATNALQKYVDLIIATPGTKLTKNETTDISFGDGYSFEYAVAFTFNSPATLNKIIALRDSLAVSQTKTGKTTTISLYPHAMTIQDKSELQSQIGDLSNATINYFLEVHAPTNITNSSDYEFEPYDDKSRKWMQTVDTDWLASQPNMYFIKF
jgi:hypothetical protein